jgi:hypothetical protein
MKSRNLRSVFPLQGNNQNKGVGVKSIIHISLRRKGGSMGMGMIKGR